MTTITAPRYRASSAVPLSMLIVAAAAGALNTGVALLGIALGADGSLPGVQAPAYLTFTTIAAIAGALGWHLISRFAKRPTRVMRWLVPTFLAVSFIPDIAMGILFEWPYAATLATMHVVTLTVGVLTFSRLMPLAYKA